MFEWLLLVVETFSCHLDLVNKALEFKKERSDEICMR